MEEKELFSTSEFPKSEAVAATAVMGGRAMAKVLTLPTELIFPDPAAAAKSYTEEELAALAIDILEKGLQNPISVVPSHGMFRILSGEKRYRACLLARLDEVRATVLFPCEEDEEKGEAVSMPPKSIFDVARLLREAILRGVHDIKSIAVSAGKSESEVRDILSLLIFSEEEEAIILRAGISEEEIKKVARACRESIECAVGKLAHGESVEYASIFAEDKKRGQNVKYAIGSAGFFINSINRAVDTMLGGGVNIRYSSEDREDCTVLTLTVPKKLS